MLGALHRAQDTTEPMALRLERSAELGARARVDRHPAIVVPIDRSVVVVEPAGGAPERIDRASIAVVPAGLSYRVRAKSAVTTLATLVIGPAARAAAAREYRPYVDERRFDALLGELRVLPRTRWVDELVARYVFERDACEKHGSFAAIFLETEITKELYFLCVERVERRTRASVVREESDLVVRARAWIDDNLYAALRVGELARRCRTSESTLLRAFQRELGTTPAAYARDRRLDASLLLLQDGRYSVGEVATRVGYASLAAFTAAFRRRFDRAPSTLRRVDGSLEVLRPDGRPLRRNRANV